jgi:BCD family chlorophyll transporter-like MFS transporter
MALNILALWKQEPRDPSKTRPHPAGQGFLAAWRVLSTDRLWLRTLLAVGLGTAAFSMQDILLEPFGGEILKLSVGATTALTGLLAIGTLAGLCVAAVRLGRGGDAYRLAGLGALVGLGAFPALIVSAPAQSTILFAVATAMIGFGSGLFSVGMLTAVMANAHRDRNGLALGAWGAVQATAAGLAIATGGAIRDIVTRLGADGGLGPAFVGPAAGYSIVYNVEIILLFATLVAIGPLVKGSRMVRTAEAGAHHNRRFGLAEFPG